jgi:hypothetical protein
MATFLRFSNVIPDMIAVLSYPSSFSKRAEVRVEGIEVRLVSISGL